MPHVQVTIAGRSYRMACGEGEERHLEALASTYDGKITELRGAFGEIGDMRLHVMAALTVADDLLETRRRIGALEAEIAALKAVSGADAARTADTERQVADALNRTAERIERMARDLGAPGHGAGPG